MSLRVQGLTITTPVTGSGQVESEVFDTALADGVGYSKFRAFVSTDQAGTLNMQQSDDEATFFTTLSQPIVAGTPLILESLCCLRYCRAQIVNGSVAQTTLTFGTTVIGGS